MNAAPVELLLSKLPDAKRNSKGWTARCPAHDDRNPSLSIAEGDDGRALVNCHANKGCTAEAICAAIGLTLADLMPATDGRDKGTVTRGSQQGPTRPHTFATAADAVAQLERQLGPRSAAWTYHDAGGEPVGMIVRFDKCGGKEIRPVARRGDGWIIGGMVDPKPLYDLPGLAGAEVVYVVEGEKAADAARSIDLTATTSPHGSKSADKADWSPLAGKSVVILPDNDPAGRSYAEAVAANLAKLTPPAIVKTVDLPDLPEGGDIVDWIDAHGDAAEPDELRRQVEALAEAAGTANIVRAAPAVRVKPYRPFPVDVLPEPASSFVREAARAIGCDASFIALPLLACLARAVGNSRSILLKRGWKELPIIWAAIVGKSGTHKTPAIQAATAALEHKQAEAIEQHKIDLKEYEKEKAEYDKEFGKWKRGKSGDPPPWEPPKPVCQRFIVSDITIEALAERLSDQFDGVVVVRDELAGWVDGIAEYKGGKGSDTGHWLAAWSGAPMTVDRKTGAKKMIHVPRASVSLVGGIQPGILHRAIAGEHMQDGLCARLLLAMPDPKPVRWTDAELDVQTEKAMATVFDRLLKLEPAAGAEGDAEPYPLSLSADAKAEWVSYYNRHRAEQADLDDDLAAAWSKLEAYTARFALIFQLVRWAAGEASDSAIDVVSIRAGIAISDWFAGEARRVYGTFAETEAEYDLRRLVEWIVGRGGEVTAREVQQGHRRFKTAGDADEALDVLAKAGFGCWEPASATAKGGRPTRLFRLSTPSTSTEPPQTSVLGGCVDVDTVDTSQTDDDDEVTEWTA